GHAMVEALFEAMQHENLIATSDVWRDVQAAVAALLAPAEDADAWRGHLKSAAQHLVTAREVLYPTTIHLLDVSLLAEHPVERPWRASFDRGLPLNIVASSSALEKLAAGQPERLALLRERIACDLVEVCGGCYQEREDALLPVESQLWNLRKGLAVARDLLG